MYTVKIFMIGEPARHMDKLAPHVPPGVELVPLPRDAGESNTYDAQIGPDDIVVSIRFTRRGTSSPRFRMLHVPGAGLDGVDMDSLPPGCVVCNVFEHEIPIAEFVMLGMLEWQIRLRDLSGGFTPERWSQIYRNRSPHGELHGKVLGLIGLGRIGHEIALRAKAFGMQVIAMGRTMRDHGGVVDRFVTPDRFGELLTSVDFIAVTCPLTAQTRDLFDTAAFARMKASAVLINVSRAEIVNEQALYVALTERHIAGAVMDVWYRYPANDHDDVPPSNEPFHTLPNVIATPHSSAWTTDLPPRRYAVIGRNITNLIDGSPLTNLVRRVDGLRDAALR
jgi:phosphoglycerate dehydrogenase-like enzyme